MKTIIAPTDFSPNSENAVLYAADMALQFDAKLCLLHVYSIPIPVSEVPVPAIDARQMEKDALEQLEKIKAKLISRTNGWLLNDK